MIELCYSVEFPICIWIYQLRRDRYSIVAGALELLKGLHIGNLSGSELGWALECGFTSMKLVLDSQEQSDI